AEYCFAVPPNAINDYSVTDNGNVYTGGYQSCGNATIQTYITIGFNFPDDYTLDSWPVNGAVFSTPSFTTASDLVDSMNVWDPLGNWTLNGLIISGGFSGNTYGNLTISLNGIGVADVLPNPQMVETHTSMVLDTGFHELVLTNNVSGCAETVLVTVNCSTPVDCTPLLDFVFLETHIGDCFEQTAVCLPTPLEEVIRYELTNNGNLYQGLVEGCNFDSLLTYAYLTLPGGGNTGPYNLNEWIVNGTTFSGEFLNVAALVDSMNVWDPSSNWTFDPTTLVISGANPANAYSSMSINQIGTGAFTSLDLNVQLRANGTQLNLGVGNHELIFTDNVNGCADTLMVSIWCLETTIVIDTLLVGDADVICLDTFELPGNVVSVQNVCAENAGDYLSFDLIDSVNCVVIQALDVGQDSACMVICDDQNLCDTTYFYYTALMDTMPPTAIADVDSTTQGQPIVINIQTNDGTQNIDTVFISNDPSFGTATVNGASGTVTYTPDPEYCNSVTPDSLTYVACNTFGCDSTTVSVYVFCNTINVMNGFSPNGDNRNDFFVIQGLEAFPDNVLRVYNRWGNLIYRMDGYDNSWNGRWEGKDLPDGTYFYVLSDGVGQTYSGYVQIHR
ncbi:MAG: gliding motility-associated C-terminal domain-containing protein, partial [Bacteroidota bacterium]